MADRIRNKKRAATEATTAAKETLGGGYEDSRPDSVSPDMWEMAKRWIDTGTGALGYRPKVNLAKFAKRFSDVVNSDEDLKNVQWLTRATLTVKRIDGKWETATSDHWQAAVVEMLRRMIKFFWESGRSGSPGVQFEFLDSEWDDLFFRAHNAIKVERLLEHPEDYGVMRRVTDMTTMLSPAIRESQVRIKNLTVTAVAQRLLDESQTEEYDRPERDAAKLQAFNKEK